MKDFKNDSNKVQTVVNISNDVLTLLGISNDSQTTMCLINIYTATSSIIRLGMHTFNNMHTAELIAGNVDLSFTIHVLTYILMYTVLHNVPLNYEVRCVRYRDSQQTEANLSMF